MQRDIEDLIVLLGKITRQTKPVGIKAHWDGKHWTWEQTIPCNPKADEYNPRELQHEQFVRTLKPENGNGHDG